MGDDPDDAGGEGRRRATERRVERPMAVRLAEMTRPTIDDFESIRKEPRYRGIFASACLEQSGRDGRPLLQRNRQRPRGDRPRGFRLPLGLHADAEFGRELARRGPGARALPCFEQAANKIEGRLRRYKQRIKGRSAPEAPGPAESAVTVTNYVVEAPTDEEEPADGFNPVVVAEGTERLKTLSVASAVAELDLSGAPVIVFAHAGSGRVNIVYRRRDGAIGWIDPR